MKTKRFLLYAALVLGALMLMSCDPEEDPKPHAEKMPGGPICKVTLDDRGYKPNYDGSGLACRCASLSLQDERGS